jgi:site-specific recombinase XerD
MARLLQMSKSSYSVASFALALRVCYCRILHERLFRLGIASNRPRSEASVSDLLDQVALRVGLTSPTRHRLRGSFCTILQQSGVPIKKIQKLMRHSRVETTMNYIEVEGTELQEAVSNLFAG